MTRRTDRIGNLIRNTLGTILLSKMSDPRFDTAKVSITHVEVPEDLLTAKVFVSVIGEQKEQNLALAALNSARGFLQERMGREISLRHTPRLSFVLDEQFKKTMETLSILQQVAQELRQKDEERAQQESGNEDD
jgi:ribosome-binding factor A